jgi:hypothetical protein
METVATLSPPKTDLSSVCAPSIDQPRLDYAAERARLLFGCYRKGDANDPETYSAAITAILAEYEPEVIQRVTDPRTGIPRQIKFLPNPAEVAEACDKARAAIKNERKVAQLGYVWVEDRWQKINAA